MSELQSVKITGSGPGRNWSITNAETGEPIPSVRRVEIINDARNGASAILYIDFPQCDVEVPAAIASEQRTQEERIAEAVIAALTGRQGRYASALERVNAREIERIVNTVLEGRLPELLSLAIVKAAQELRQP